MSQAGVHRQSVEPGDWAPASAARRRIEVSDIAFAQARRPRASWQALANMLGVNALDLRRAVEGAEHAAPAVAEPAPLAPGRPAPARPVIPRVGSLTAKVLLAVGAGAEKAADIAATFGCSPLMVSRMLYILGRRRLVDAYRLTPLGREAVGVLTAKGMFIPEVARARALPGEGLMLRRAEAVVAALAAGAVSFNGVAELTGLEMVVTYSAVSRARREGWVDALDKRTLALTPAGEARAAQLADLEAGDA